MRQQRAAHSAVGGRGAARSMGGARAGVASGSGRRAASKSGLRRPSAAAAAGVGRRKRAIDVQAVAATSPPKIKESVPKSNGPGTLQKK